MKLCDLTQFYSPASGGVRRYVGEKVRHLRAHAPGDQHILIIPGEEDACTGDATARTYTIRSPLVSRTSRYRILLLLGDDLGDFTSVASQSRDNRSAFVEQHKENWGTRWIVIPNPIYGSWERAVLGSTQGVSEQEQLERKLKAMDAAEN